MNKLQEILDFNRSFVENKEYDKYKTSKLPTKKLVILSCMDTRLTELLPKALNFKNGIILRCAEKSGYLIFYDKKRKT